ncbi:hypothetical protein CLOP_g20650 [Closterium sp. NIES-67]|nr:hypothetical protein CLOP_g20650 [Closterium sp. NIES-67]
MACLSRTVLPCCFPTARSALPCSGFALEGFVWAWIWCHSNCIHHGRLTSHHYTTALEPCFMLGGFGLSCEADHLMFMHVDDVPVCHTV